VPLALADINSQLAGSGILAVADAAGTGISLQSDSAVQRQSDAVRNGTGCFHHSGLQPGYKRPPATATSTGSALAALAALTTAISNLGIVQGTVGAGENKLQYATNLAQSQITNVLGRRIRHSRRRRRGRGGQPDQSAGAATDVPGRAFSGQLRTAGCAFPSEEFLMSEIPGRS
jgi:hypothetical protein